MASTASSIAFGVAALQGRRNGLCFRQQSRRVLLPQRLGHHARSHTTR